MVFLVLFGLHLALFGVLLRFTERGTSRRWSWAEIAALAVCAPLLVLGWAVLPGGWGATARTAGLVGLWVLLFVRFSQLLMGTPTGRHTVDGVLAEIEGIFVTAGDDESAGLVRRRRDGLAAARTTEEVQSALRLIEEFARPGNGRMSDRFVASSAANTRLTELWPVLGALAARGRPRPRI
jgi:hypothetical protein